MRFRLFLVFIWIIATCTACLSSRTIKKRLPGNPGLAQSISALSGLYSNRPLSFEDHTSLPLAQLLFAPLKRYKWDEEINYQGQIRLKALDLKHLQVEFWQGDSLCCEKTLSGKWRDNYFELKRNIKGAGVPFIYFFYTEQKLLLSKNESDNLIVKQGRSGYGNILIMSAGNRSFVNFEYQNLTDLPQSEPD